MGLSHIISHGPSTSIEMEMREGDGGSFIGMPMIGENFPSWLTSLFHRVIVATV
jgi:hypothetical protein